MSRNLIITLLIFIANSLSSQTWVSSVVSDPWDGDYIIAYTKGYGGESPYTSPTLRIEKTKKEIRIYIKDLGYTGCSSNQLDFIFDNKRKYSARGNSSTTRDALFIDGGFYTYEDKELLTLYHLLNELTISSNLKVRFTNDCSVNVFSFSLSGSSKAIYKLESKDVIKEKVNYYNNRYERARARKDSIANFTRMVQLKNDSIKSTLRPVDEIINTFIAEPRYEDRVLEGVVFKEIGETKQLIKEELDFFSDYGDVVNIYFEQSASPGYYRLCGDFLKEAEINKNIFLYVVFQVNSQGQLYLLN